MDFSALLSKLVILFTMMLVGYFCAKGKILGPDFTKSASWLTLNVFMSSSIINAVTAKSIEMNFREVLVILGVAALSLVLMYAVSRALVELLPFPPERKNLLELLMSVTNNMFLGLPVAVAIFGDGPAALYMSLSCLPFNAILYTYGVSRLRGQKNLRPADFLRSVLSPPLIATLIAILLLVCPIRVPSVAVELISTLSGATVPVSMLVVGASLGRVSLLDAFREKSLYFVVFERLILMPVIVWGVLMLMNVERVLRGTMVIMAGCATGVAVTALAITYGKDGEYTSQGILMSTLLSMVTMPLMAYFLL